MADIFVSFTKSDQRWAHWIAQELTALDHEPHVHDWEIEPGEDIVGWMEKRHDQADYILCVVSRDYLDEGKAPFSTWERRAALWRMVKGRKGHVLLFVVEPVKLPSLIDHFRRCDLFGLKENEARRRIAEFLRSPAPPPETIEFPGEGGVAVSNVPVAVPEHFLGREDALEAVDVALKRHEGRVAVTAVHGLLGVGKTTLAAAYAERHRGEYRATWWVRAQTADLTRADLVALGVRLGWVELDEKEVPAFDKVMERLRHEGAGLLIIYDNAIQADALKPFLPKGGAARVLVTSTAPNWRSLGATIELGLWPKETGADYLIARTGRAAERPEAELLSEVFGGLPLAYEQAAAYSERLGVSFAEYFKRFQAAPILILNQRADAPLEYHDKRPVATTFMLAIDAAGELNVACKALLDRLAILSADAIPSFVILDAPAVFLSTLQNSPARDTLEDALSVLHSFALISREQIQDERDQVALTPSLRVHRLLREIVRGAMSEDARLFAVADVVKILEREVPVNAYTDLATWPKVRRLRPPRLFNSRKRGAAAEPGP